MAKSDGKRTYRRRVFSAKGIEASQLRRRRGVLSRRFGLPDDILGGSLVLSHRRCGKPSCWCADDDGHPQWTLTYSVEGSKRVESIPADLVDQLMPFVNEGKTYRDAVAEIRSINAQLLRLWRLEEREKKGKAAAKKEKKGKAAAKKKQRRR